MMARETTLHNENDEMYTSGHQDRGIESFANVIGKGKTKGVECNLHHQSYPQKGGILEIFRISAGIPPRVSHHNRRFYF